MTPSPNPTVEQWAEAIQLLCNHAHNPVLDRLAEQVMAEYVASLSPAQRTQLTERALLTFSSSTNPQANA